MNLRQYNYPPKYWLQLHNHTINPTPSPPPKKPRHPSNNKINKCLTSLVPHLQKVIYSGAIDKRKGEIRSSKFPISSEQFTLMNHFGLTHAYKPAILLEQELKLEYNFIYKGYARGIENIQFRLQKQKPVIPGQNPILILRTRFHQKAPVLHESLPSDPSLR
jgi:hypothetical protein